MLIPDYLTKIDFNFVPRNLKIKKNRAASKAETGGFVCDIHNTALFKERYF